MDVRKKVSDDPFSYALFGACPRCGEPGGEVWHESYNKAIGAVCRACAVCWSIEHVPSIVRDLWHPDAERLFRESDQADPFGLAECEWVRPVFPTQDDIDARAAFDSIMDGTTIYGDAPSV